LLYQTVAEFFGNCFVIVEQDQKITHSSVSFNVPLDIDNPQPISVILELCMNQLVAPSLMHELLHMKMAVNGFPITVQTDLAYGELAALYTTGAISILNNALGHAIFLSDFLAMGFPQSHFHFESTTRADPLEARRHSETTFAVPGASIVRRGLWDIICFCQHLEAKLGFDNKEQRFLEIGRELFPDTIDGDTREFSDWLSRGEFRNPDRYAPSVRGLLRYIGLPVPIFRRLERHGDAILPIVQSESA
jgi:hypothetical protein